MDSPVQSFKPMQLQSAIHEMKQCNHLNHTEKQSREFLHVRCLHPSEVAFFNRENLTSDFDLSMGLFSVLRSQQ
jgi:hypothetical protein